MPLGAALKEKIAGVLPHQNGGDDFVRHVLFVDGDLNVNSRACLAIRTSLPKASSIDSLIEHRGHDDAFKYCAKVGIVAAIMLSEHRSGLHRPRGSPLGTISAEECTYAAIFRMIVGNSSVRELPEAIRRVGIVNFNYDRCLEHYFHDWLIGYSGLDSSEAWNLVDQLVVVRPYGWIGALPGMQRGRRESVAFGAGLDGLEMGLLSKNILTFSEERASDVDEKLGGLTGDAHQVIFLGCAYHPQNLSLVRPKTSQARRIYGTCYVVPPTDKRSEPSLESFSAPTRDAFTQSVDWPADSRTQQLRRIQFEPLTCQQFTAKYGAEWTEPPRQ